MHNTHSVITDPGTLSVVRTAERVAYEIRRGFEMRERRVAMLKECERRRRREVVKESVRAVQCESKASKSQFASELISYTPPLEPVVTDSLEARDLPSLLDRMARDQTASLHTANGFREGMSVKKMLAVAKAAKESSEEAEVAQRREEQLMSALNLSADSTTFRQWIQNVLKENRSLSPIGTAYDTQDAPLDDVTSDDQEGVGGRSVMSPMDKFDDEISRVSDADVFRFLNTMQPGRRSSHRRRL